MFYSLLQKQARKAFGRPTARVEKIPAPTGGWNAKDSLSDMKDSDAIVLDNIVPGTGRVSLRPGYTAWASAIPGNYVETLMEYSPPTALNRLFAAAGTSIFDVTAPGAVTGAVAGIAGANGRWQHTMFAALGNTYLVCCHEGAAYLTYDGASWVNQNPNITGLDAGVTAADFANVSVHMSRLWFVQRSSLNVWYLPTGSITGAAQKLNLAPQCKEGGYLVACGSWSKDGGEGMDDGFVAVTSRGEVIVYQGTDPTNAATWELVGRFKVAEPVGRRCLLKVGGDIGIITSTGVALLSQLIGVNLSGQRKVTITNKISDAFIEAYKVCGSAFGWQITEFPSRALVVINVPLQERALAVQFVINVETGAWCRWTNINSGVWGLFGGNLYFGDYSGNVFQFGDALSDNGQAINWTIQSAFNLLRSPQTKTFKMVRPFIIASKAYAPGINLKMDYDTSPFIPASTTGISASGALWDLSLWDISFWGTSVEMRAIWQGVEGEGRAVSLCMSGSVQETTFEYNTADIMFEPGGWL